MKLFILVFALLLPLLIFPQVGIGTDSPKAQLDIVSGSPGNPEAIDGILIPRIDKFPAVNPSSDQHGMLVFLNKETAGKKSGFHFWNNSSSSWESVGGNVDGNFYKPGTSINPGNIDDALYREGNIGIGTQELTAKLQISLNTTRDAAIKKGLEIDNNNPATDNLTTYGIISDNRSATNGNKYGFKNNVGGLGTGIHYGIFNETYQNTGTNDIYGIFNRVGRTFGAKSNNFGIYSQIGTVQGSGNIYGIYSTALGDNNANVFAGYFAGRLGIGSTPQEEYIFPAVRGKADQIFILQSSGALNWTYNTIRNYSTTGGASGGFQVTDEVYSLRINDQVSHVIIPAANENKGRIMYLLAWKGTRSKPLQFSNNDDLYDLVNDTSITAISGNTIMKIQSAGNRWLLLEIRKVP